MKYFAYGLLSILLLISLLLLNVLNPVIKEPLAPLPEKMDYHIALITEGDKDPFWSAFIKGAKKAGIDENVLVEIIPIKSNSAEQMATAIDRAILSDVQAIALQPIDDIAVVELLADAQVKGIHILTFENDAYTLESAPTVGSNNYQIGQSAAKLAIEATGKEDNAHIALFLNDKKSGDTRYKSLKLQGLIEELSSYSNMSIDSIYTLDFDPFEAEKLTKKILTEHPEVNVIICTDERRTPGIAQTIVDMDKVGEIQIIGFGSMEQTIKYVEKGIIYGTICADGYEIGYTTVTSLVKMILKEPFSESLSTTIYTFTKENLDSYYQYFTESRFAE